MSDASSVLVPICMFGMITAVVLVPAWLKSRERERMHDTLQKAYAAGQPVPPELIAALQQPASQRAIEPPGSRAERDLRRAIVWLFIGLGVIAIGLVGYAIDYARNDGYSWAGLDLLGSFAGLGMIPFFIGLAFLLLWSVGRGASRRKS